MDNELDNWVCLWPDNDWCYKEDLTDYSWKSDDYEVIPYENLPEELKDDWN